MQTSRGLDRRDNNPSARYGATGPSVKLHLASSPVLLLHLFLSCVISPHVCVVPLYTVSVLFALLCQFHQFAIYYLSSE